MTIITREQQLAHNHNFESNGKLYLVNCYACGSENYALMVASGQCAWCGWKEDSPDVVAPLESFETYD